MPIIKRSCIEEMRSRISIYDVVEPYVALKKSGPNWRGLSPFTQEKTPSFYALTDKNIFKCFSSGHAGDIFRFIQLKENLNFQEAAETLGQRFSVKIEYEISDAQEREKYSLKKQLLDIHAYAADFYHACLFSDNTDAKSILRYWTEKRQFSLDTAKAFKIGLALPNDRTLIEKLLKKGFSFEAVKASGLFYARDHDKHPSRLKPRFSGRLMIPIRDIQGRVIAFSARQLDITPSSDPAAEAKYINSPETPLFNKSYVLFGLDEARKHLKEDTSALLVEGQLDVIRCHSVGLKTAIAPQGTSVTPHQLGIIRRYTPELECLLDGDDAGQKAALRLLPMAFEAGLESRFLAVPQGQDPDSYFQSHGAEGLKTLRSEGLSSVTFAYKALTPTSQPSPRQKAEAVHQVLSILKHCDSAIAQKEYLLELARSAHVDLHTIELDFSKIKQKNTANSINKSQDKGKSTPNPSQKLTTVEYELLLIVLHYEDLAKDIAHILETDWIAGNTLHAKLLIRFLNELKEDIRHSLQPLDELLETEEEYNCAYTILSQKPPFEDPIKSANICIQTIFQQSIDARKQTIEKQIAALSSDNTDKLRPLLQERIELRRLLSKPPKLQKPVYTIS